jgi:hypothetical protein
LQIVRHTGLYYAARSQKVNREKNIFNWQFNIELAVLNEMVACVMKDQKLEEIIRIAYFTEFEMQFPPSSNHEFETPQNLFCRPTRNIPCVFDLLYPVLHFHC